MSIVSPLELSLIMLLLAGQVSIGADEYDASLADDYNNFANAMVRMGRSNLQISR